MVNWNSDPWVNQSFADNQLNILFQSFTACFLCLAVIDLIIHPFSIIFTAIDGIERCSFTLPIQLNS